MARFLVTGIGMPAGLSLARHLRQQGHWVLGTDVRQVSSNTADAVAEVSASDSPGHLWELRGLVAVYGLEFLLPTVSSELVLFSEAKDRFAPGVQVMIADPAPVRTAHDKFLTMTCLANAGVGVPAFALPGKFASVHHAMDRLGGPLVAKPRVSGSGRRIRKLERTFDGGRHAARIWSTLDDSWIVQRFAPGTEYAPVVFRGGTLPQADDLVVVLEKAESGSGRMGNAPSVRRVEGPEVADVVRLASSALAALGLTGLADVDIRRMPDGTPVVLGINAGFGANSGFAPELMDRVLAHNARGQLSVRPV